MTTLITASNGSRQPMFLAVLSVFVLLSYTAVGLRFVPKIDEQQYGLRLTREECTVGPSHEVMESMTGLRALRWL